MEKKNTIKTILIIVAVVLVAWCLFSYLSSASPDAPNNTNMTAANTVSASGASESTTSSDSAATQLVESDSGYAFHEWSAEEAPNGYVVRGNAVVDFDVNPGEYHYSDLDSLGRTQTAYAIVTKADYERELSEDREDANAKINNISGFKGNNVKATVTWPNGKQYSSYFYNRSHLIADSLGGAAKVENLVAGSRFQNVGYDGKGGMAYAETKARNWLAANDGFVYYCVTPVYNGDELVPRSVYVDMLSSDGSLDEHVEVYNVSGDVLGNVTIDYATGEVLVNN